MSERHFAPWVEPIALRLNESRRDIEQVVRRVPDGAWENPSEYPSWSYKDHLSHLPHAHRGVKEVIQAVIDGRDPDFSRFGRIDDMNEVNRQEQLATPVNELLAAFVSESEKTEVVLTGLKAEHAEARFGPMTISQALQGFAMHDMEHLEVLKKALPA